MGEELYIHTGKLRVSKTKTIFRTSAIGSCVVVATFCSNFEICGMAHILLPGRGQENAEAKYAEDAVDELLQKMENLGASKNDLACCLVGGANVLKRENETIGDLVSESVIESLKKHRIETKAQSIGGVERHTMTLNMHQKTIYYTRGNSNEMILYQDT